MPFSSIYWSERCYQNPPDFGIPINKSIVFNYFSLVSLVSVLMVTEINTSEKIKALIIAKEVIYTRLNGLIGIYLKVTQEYKEMLKG